MDRQKMKSDLDRAENIVTEFNRKMAAIDPDLKAEVIAERKRTIVGELISNPDGLTAIRRRLRAGVDELRAEREGLADPQTALLIAAWARASELTPSQLAIMECCKNASPATLGRFLTMVENNPPALAVWGNILQERRAELDADKSYGPLSERFQQLAARHIPRASILETARIEHRALTLEYKIMSELDNAEGASKLSMARKVAEIEKVLSNAA